MMNFVHDFPYLFLCLKTVGSASAWRVAYADCGFVLPPGCFGFLSSRPFFRSPRAIEISLLGWKHRSPGPEIKRSRRAGCENLPRSGRCHKDKGQPRLFLTPVLKKASKCAVIAASLRRGR